MSFRVKTDNGTHYVNDPNCFTVSVWVTEQEEANGLRSAKINSILDDNKDALEDLIWVCDATRPPHKGTGMIYDMYFAHQGLFHFVPNHRRGDVN